MKTQKKIYRATIAGFYTWAYSLDDIRDWANGIIDRYDADVLKISKGYERGNARVIPANAQTKTIHI